MSEGDRPGAEGGEQTFRVRDRRQFTSEGERREGMPAEPDSKADAAGAGAQAPRPAAAREPVPPPMPPAAEEPPKKRSLRERILGRKARDEDAAVPGPGAAPPEGSADDINFPNFVLSLMTQTLMHMGEIPDPMTQEVHRDLGMAKQTIDLIAMLEQKTKGNLTPEEAHLMAEVLYRLRMQFVESAKRA